MKIFYLLGIIILIIIIFYFLNNYNFIIEKFEDSNYTSKKLDFGFDFFDTRIDQINDKDYKSSTEDYKSKNIKTANDALKYYESNCNNNSDCVAFLEPNFDPKYNSAYDRSVYLNNKINNKIFINIYTNDRDQNNSQINYKEFPNSTVKNMYDDDIVIKMIGEKERTFENGKMKITKTNDISLPACKKLCNENKDCYGIQTGTIIGGNACVTFKKKILDTSNIIPVNYDNLGEIGKVSNIYYKNDYLNSISTDKNDENENNLSTEKTNNSLSTENLNNYTEKKLDHMLDMDCLINTDSKPLPPNYIDKDKIKNIKTYDDLLNYNKLICDKNKDCFGFFSKKIDKKELDKFKPEDFQKMTETYGNFIFFNDKINNKISSNIYVNDRNENNPNINYKKNPNSMLKDYNNATIDWIQETQSIYNNDNKKWETKKNDVSLDICKKKCNDDKDCYGIGDFFNYQKACVTYKKDALKSENIISDQKQIDSWCNLINSTFSMYYKDIPNKNSSKNIGFDVTGSHPSQSGSSWSNNITQKTKNLFNKKNCEVGYSCSTPNGFGTYNSNCDCIVNSIEKNNEKKYEENQEECNLQCDSNNLNKNKNLNQNNLNQKNTIKCYPNNSNFSKICSDQNPTYGVKQINLCDDRNTSSVVCDSNYLNGKYVGTSILTPCLNKTDDFDVWCKYYNTKPVPDGYNINSIGVKNLLVGKEGECYLNNNNPDNSKARAICDYNYIDNVTKIKSSELKNNNFTDCSPINSNFNILCSNLSKTSIASEIMGYDCNPGFARAKCIDGDSIFIDNNSSNNLLNNMLINNVFSDVNVNDNNYCRTNCKKN